MLEQKKSSGSLVTAISGLPEIDMSKSNEILDALRNNRGFITDLGGNTEQVVEKLFQSYNEFIKQPKSYKDIYKGEDTKNTKGYYEDNIVNGNKIGPRFFIQRNPDGKVDQNLPLGLNNPGIRELNETLYATLQPIIDRTIIVLEDAYNFERNALKSKVFAASATSLHHNTPVNQEKLCQWLESKQITKTEDGQIEAMMTHKDLVGITLLIYRYNNAKGLEVKIKTDNKKGYVPIELPASKGNVKVLVILGRLINYFIPSLKGLSHRVTATQLKPSESFSRDVINVFALPDIMAQLSKKNSPEKYSIGDYFTEVFSLYEKRRLERAVSKLDPEEVHVFPEEKNVETIKDDHGISYRIKSI